MKHISKTFALSALLASTMLFSCSQEEINPDINISNPENGEFVLSVNVPDEIRTRDGASGSVGSDGLYTFSREIDRLWYAVYYDGEYLYDSETPDVAPTTKTSDGHFKVPFKFHNAVDYSKVYIFFWAGNAEDNVTTNDVTSVTDGINLNFARRCVSVDPKYMNGNNTELKQYDSFAGYVQLSQNTDGSNFNQIATLHRPFAQIHILSDEFTFPGVKMDFRDGVTVRPGFGEDKATSANYASSLMAPSTWYFDNTLEENDTYKKNDLIYTANNYEFTNTLSGTSPEQVTFKGRKMDYLGCFYVLAPIEKSTLKDAGSGNKVYGKVNLALRKAGDTLDKSEFASVDLPEDGIKANNKYVIYNKPYDTSADSPGTDGNGGFLSSEFIFDVIIDDEWGDTEEIDFPQEPKLEDIAWGVPLKETEDPNWGRVGNLALWEAYKAKIGRYLMDGEGHAAKLNPANSGLWPDGSEVDESKGNVMVIAPNLYYYVEENELLGYPTLWMSESPISDKRIGGENEYIIIGAYKGSLVNNKLVSNSSKKPETLKTIYQFWDSAQINGSNYGLLNWNHIRYFMMLALSEYGNTDIKGNLGYGVGGRNAYTNWVNTFSYLTGSTKTLGDANGNIKRVKEPTQYLCSDISLFGIENPYKWQWEMVQGIYFGSKYNSEQESTDVYIYEENRIPTESELKTHPASNYRKITRTSFTGAISKMYIGEYFDLIPVAKIPNVTTSGDFNYWSIYNMGTSDGQLCLHGSQASSNYDIANCSFGSLNSENQYNSYSTSYSARLAYYGPVTFVDPEYFK